MEKDDEELEVIRRAAAGDPAAQQRFLLQHRELLLRYLKRRLPDGMRRQIEPQDIYQDVCFEVFRRMNTLTVTDPGMAVRWLLRIARNRLIHLYRMQQSAKRGGGRLAELHGNESVGEDSVVKLLQQLAVYARTPSRSAAHHELLAALESSLERLPEEYRQVIRLRYIEGWSIEETAERMNRKSGAVRMLCARGLVALRIELQSFSRYI